MTRMEKSEEINTRKADLAYIRRWAATMYSEIEFLENTYGVAFKGDKGELKRTNYEEYIGKPVEEVDYRFGLLKTALYQRVGLR